MALVIGGTAPYAPPAVVTDLIERNRQGTLPSPVVPNVLLRVGVSESLVPRTLQTLKLLDFVDPETGEVTPKFKALQTVATPEFKPAVVQLLREAYAPVFEVVDPSGADYDSVKDAFRSFKPIGQIGRALTLFLGLLDYAGLPDLPTGAMTGRQGRPAGSRSRRAPSESNRKSGRPRKDEPTPQVRSAPVVEQPSVGETTTIDLGPAGTVTVIANLRWLELSDRQVDDVRTAIRMIQRLPDHPDEAGKGETDTAGP